MGREKVTVIFLILLIGVFSYMIASLVYKESFRSEVDIKALDVSLNSQ